MQPPPALVELRVVGDGLGERVLEGVLDLGVGRLLPDEVGARQLVQHLVELARRHARDRLELLARKLRADHGRGLEHVLGSLV